MNLETNQGMQSAEPQNRLKLLQWRHVIVPGAPVG